MLDSLTGTPLPEDEILFAVPVIAPYNALHSYKYVHLLSNFKSSCNYLHHHI